MKRLLPWVLASLIIGYLGIIFSANRSLYTSRFDQTYWKDRFDHSQWKLPQSERGIGDDGLYLYEGYELIHGADSTLYNAEVPPLGKYIIGTSISLFGNGYLFGILTTLAALVAFFFLAKSFLSRYLALAATLLVAMDPLITSQFATTMLESSQLVFLLLLCLGLSQKKYYTVFLGLMFGAFSAIKFPLLSPLLGIFIGYIIWQKAKRVSLVMLFVLVSFITYLTPYLRYFSLGHSFAEWLGVQKWIINFYLHAKLLPNFGSFVTALAAGRIQNLFTRNWEQITEWSPVWPLIFLVSITWCIIHWKKHWILISIFFLGILLYNLIPFWTRYLVLFLPIFYLLAIIGIKTYTKRFFPIIIALMFIINGIVSFQILFPTPQQTVTQFLYDWQHGFFQDMYEQLDSTSQNTISRTAFHRLGLQTFLDGEIEKVAITNGPVVWSRLRSPQTIRLNITYVTRNLGSFTQATILPIMKEQNRWRISWNWDVLINGLTDNTKLETHVHQAKRGNIIASDGTILAEDVPSFFVSVIPQQIDGKQEENMLKFLENELDQRVAAIGLYRRYMQNSLPDQPVPLAVFMKPLNNAAYKKLLSYSGIRLTPWFGRQKKENPPGIMIGTVANTQFSECCSLLYNATVYDGINGLEKKYNNILKGENGGSLILKDQYGAIIRTLIQKEKQDGKTVKL